MQLADGDVASRTVFNWLLMDAWKLDANKVNERVISGRGGASIRWKAGFLYYAGNRTELSS